MTFSEISHLVVTGATLKIMEGFHHRVSRRIAGMTEKCVTDGTWEYTPVVADLEAAGLYPIQEYIWRQYATIAEKVAYNPIYELCTRAELRPGTIRMMRR